MKDIKNPRKTLVVPAPLDLADLAIIAGGYQSSVPSHPSDTSAHPSDPVDTRIDPVTNQPLPQGNPYSEGDD